MNWTSFQQRRILVLSDLHCGDYRQLKRMRAYSPKGKRVFAGMTVANLKKLLRFVANGIKEDIHHVIILGDLNLYWHGRGIPHSQKRIIGISAYAIR